MKVLLSIKPEFIRLIFSGIKKFEFRKSIFKKSEVKSVLIYATSPVKRVVGEFEIVDILTDDVDEIWNKTREYSGISKSFYQSYFHNRKVANAIQIGRVEIYQNFKHLSDFNIKNAPQSFCYVDESLPSIF